METPHGFSQDPNGTYDQGKPRQLPADLPKSLDDRQPVRNLGGETEMYDAWQGQSHFLMSPMPAQPLAFNLSLDDPTYDEGTTHKIEDSDSRLMEMLAAQAAHREDEATAGDEDKVLADKMLPDSEKKVMLQKSLHTAASNGDVDRVNRVLQGKAKSFIDVNAADEEGRAPIIYASCFGHEDVVQALIRAGANVDKKDRNQWTALMWAMTNRHKNIAKMLLDNGASSTVKSSMGRSAFDFPAPNSEISGFLHQNGYHIGDVGVEDDFYDTGFSQDKFEQEMEENEMRRRMMMESSMNLEVDLSSLGMDERPESPEEFDEQQDFIWDRCLNDQMFVFQESELGRILDIVITEMTPQRTPSQKPVPANILFLGARYAHYHASSDLLATLLVSAMDKINAKVENHQWDMTVLAFWISNATLLLHYLKKDAGLVEATPEFQVQLVELINEIFILIIRDAERRMDKVLDASILAHETIPFDDLEFVGEWKIFNKKKPQTPEPVSYKPPPPNRRAQPSPRNVTSLLSSTLFVLDLYDIHSVITAQILAQLFYWIGAELFNHVLSTRTYLARTKAMQIRMNISVLEDWARSNNRVPEHYENGSLLTSGESTVDAARRYFTPVIQLLQWLQCFSSLGEKQDIIASLENTLIQIPRLGPQHLLYVASHYRFEKDEKGLPKEARRYLTNLQADMKKRAQKIRQNRNRASSRAGSEPRSSVSADQDDMSNGAGRQEDEDLVSDTLLMDPAHMLQFSLPTTVDMRITYGAGYGGVNREREKKYIPTVPPEFLAKLDLGGGGSSAKSKDWGNAEFDTFLRLASMEVQALSPEVIQDINIAPIPSDVVPTELIESTFGPSCIDLISSSLNSSVLAFSDEWFAPASNLTNPKPPIRRPGVFVPTGAWYDGWETRRHNPEPYDWVIVKLGVASGKVQGIEIDTAFFDGNHAEAVEVHGCLEVGEDADTRIVTKDYAGWRRVLGHRGCGPSQRHAWKVEDEREITHVRLCMFPDGGIARFRLYGKVVPVFPTSMEQEVELSSALLGGMVLSASEEHFGSSKSNLLLPGRGIDMGGGWETRRSRGQGHLDWVIVRLGARGEVRRVVVDTAFYRGNFPQAMKVEAYDCGEETLDDEDPWWTEILGLQKLGPDKEHEYAGSDLKNVERTPYTHLKMTIVPDGGVKRFRVFGSRV
ncbi:MAG: hypothetical protein Q9166_005036 [cf. Caloplaca sp. 2 TL-2023]